MPKMPCECVSVETISCTYIIIRIYLYVFKYSMQIYKDSVGWHCTYQAPFFEKIYLPIKTASSYYQRLQPEGLVPQPPNIPLGLTAGSSDNQCSRSNFVDCESGVGRFSYRLCNDIYIYTCTYIYISSDLVIRVQDSKFALNLSANVYDVYGVRECKKGPQCPKRPRCPRKARNLLQ